MAPRPRLAVMARYRWRLFHLPLGIELPFGVARGRPTSSGGIPSFGGPSNPPGARPRADDRLRAARQPSAALRSQPGSESRSSRNPPRTGDNQRWPRARSSRPRCSSTGLLRISGSHPRPSGVSRHTSRRASDSRLAQSTAAKWPLPTTPLRLTASLLTWGCDGRLTGGYERSRHIDCFVFFLPPVDASPFFRSLATPLLPQRPISGDLRRFAQEGRPYLMRGLARVGSCRFRPGLAC